MPTIIVIDDMNDSSIHIKETLDSKQYDILIVEEQNKVILTVEER